MKITLGSLKQVIQEVINDDELNVPSDLPFRTRQEWSCFDALTNEPQLIGELPEESVNVKDLVPTQDMKSTGTDPGNPDEPITVFELNGKLFIIDGHHRFKRALKKKISRLTAHVIHANSQLFTIKSFAKMLSVPYADVAGALHPSDRDKYCKDLPQRTYGF